uniref:Uncharacterized protein n=1 Tax=Zea mays TaxID=4577 RepID=C0PFK0_MAIZE|nr:unknown [Zea mays]
MIFFNLVYISSADSLASITNLPSSASRSSILASLITELDDEEVSSSFFLYDTTVSTLWTFVSNECSLTICVLWMSLVSLSIQVSGASTSVSV